MRLLLALLLALTILPANAETLVERGAYLGNAVAACAACHTPREPPGPTLSGGNRYGAGDRVVFAQNITPEKATGIGAWTDAHADRCLCGVEAR